MLQVRYSEAIHEAGTDEVGRGCLAGPVVAAAVMLPQRYRPAALRDSKKLSARVRNELRQEIQHYAIAYGIGAASPQEIDQINILQASFLAMHRALRQLSPQPAFILVDGNRFRPYDEVPYACIVKGDNRFLSIAAASVLAKTERDALMHQLDQDFPEYGWKTNVGYPTRTHRAAIQTYGSTPHHRQSFRLLPESGGLF